MSKIYHARNGYTLLLTVLVVGTMASATSIALILLGMGVERSSYSMQLSSQAFHGALACVENAIASLQADLEYDGNERREYTYAYDDNGVIAYGITECTIYPIGGTENEDRTICTEATFGNFTTRRLEVNLDRVVPGAAVNSWEEVATIESCNPFTGPPPEDCGNGDDQDAGEECDDGNTKNNDGCSSVCMDEVCGDGIQQAGEQCDDGNVIPGDDCDELCKSEICGDMIEAASEECDDGNTENNDGCSSMCMDEVCGDGIIQNDSRGEECDDPDINLCNADCTLVSVVTPSPTDYIGHWKLDETNAAVDVVDSSPEEEDGEPKNGAGINLSDKAPLSFSNTASRDFDGVDDYIKFTGNSSHLFPVSITVSFWVKSDVSPGSRDGIVCKTNSNTWTQGWGFYFNSNSQVTFFIEEYWLNYARSTINPTEWNHIVGTYNGSDMKIYVNGIGGSISDTYSGNPNTGKKLTIGRCGDSDLANAFNLNGKIDDVRVYDYVLTADEISALASGN